ncbi:peroxiredoxin family protein [Phaeodactylibacter luteus]|uniref:Redoxin domain-containing protein n=1 Tax=Phaeodactylibacter luteus TaxID=1564516 RepID=A0A5C6RL95_9BACT|nr:thioredoxin-like domain-containing protein [Phaeodactylibacter luteus]TXB62725.1 redoxin domain-containing protein [Phaeodactylibacter luteus]
MACRSVVSQNKTIKNKAAGVSTPAAFHQPTKEKVKYWLVVFIFLGLSSAFAQSISMEFPAFAGKTYDFVIFQGSKAEKVMQDTIPQNGKFTLTIPEKYAPYTGMCRWLLTNSETGGGIDMAIPGHDFAISCLSDKPDNTNIVYTGFDAVNELNRLNGEQQKIIDRYETMSRAARLYDTTHPLYATFQKEKAVQAQAYERFHEGLKQNSNYNARFLPIVNLMQGYAHRLSDDEYEKGQLFNEYFTRHMSIQDLYVSGHWEGIIQSWVQYQAHVVNDKDKFAQDFKALHDKMTNPAQYTDFVGKMTFYLTQYGKDDYVQAIANEVIRSGKITSYEGKTMQAYVTAMVGSQAPALILTRHIGDVAAHEHEKKVLQSSDLARDGYDGTLLIFYQSGCGPCENLMPQLSGNYELLKEKGIRLISISADENIQVFDNTARQHPWPDKYCDEQGMNGPNFTAYGVAGTPTMFLLDAQGRIELRAASLDDIISYL